MDRARRIPSPTPTGFVTTRGDRPIAALAARQYGVVARRQLRALGYKETAIANRVAAGRLHRVHQGVYAVGHPLLSLRGRWMAATLACGSGAALSHAAAAALWELRATSATTIDVTVPTAGGRRRRAGLRVHRDPALAADEVTVRDGIQVTTPARTILDLAATLSERELERLLDQAEVERLADMFSFDVVLAKHAGHHRAAKLRRTLAHHAPGTTLTKSELEERFLAVCRAHGLPQPHVNATVAGLEADFLFDAPHRLIVETDGWQYHGTRAAFERDRARDARLARAGYRTLRFTDRQIAHDPETVAETVAIALGQSRVA
jgi:very-short-patch-repair endonuclease/predicted transcriptional regulator of viral defense system